MHTVSSPHQRILNQGSKTAVIDPRLVESMDAKSEDMVGYLHKLSE